MLVVLAVLSGCSEYDVNDESSIGKGAPDPIVPTATEVQAMVVVDDFVVPPPKPIDILFVVDNSCSMEEEQNAIAQNFPAVIDVLYGSGIDWRVGVVSTDMQDPSHRGKLRQTLDGSTWTDGNALDPHADFMHMARLGVSGYYHEAGRDAVHAALDGSLKHNEDFLRDDAKLLVVVVSDENDYSHMGLKKFRNWFTDLKSDPRDIYFSSIVGPPGQSCAAEPGSDYVWLTDQIGGVKLDICNGDWQLALSSLTDIQVLAYQHEFTLSYVPNQRSIETLLDDEVNVYVLEEGECADCWTYDPVKNSLSFPQLLPERARLKVTYEAL